MSDNNDSNDSNDSEANAESEGIAVNPDELSDDVLNDLMTHPQIQRYVKYNETSIPQISAMLDNLVNGKDEESEDEADERNQTVDLLVEGIADRSGRVSEATVRKVLNGFVAEYESTEN